MTRATRFLIFALAFNIVVLVPVVGALLLDPGFVERGFGAVTDARLILTSVYISIGAVSAVLIAMHMRRHAWAVPMTVALFAVQITYKLLTVPMVGPGNPVVLSNLVVVAVQVVALAALRAATRKAAPAA